MCDSAVQSNRKASTVRIEQNNETLIDYFAMLKQVVDYASME